MSDYLSPASNLPPEQEAIRAKCFHPSGTFIEFPKEEIEQSIPERFEKIVRFYPDRLAVRTKSRALTYDELNKAANRLARAILTHRGQGQEPVALCLRDGVQLITAHLAVLKAGKFSLGLDPSASPDRRAHLLRDSQAALVVTDAETGPIARHGVNREQQVINMDEAVSSTGEQDLGLAISPRDYSYLRYTSGSTGQAKGALKTHRHVMHAVMNATNYFHICAADRSMLLSRASCFGKNAFEVLLNGATLCPFYIADEGLAYLADWLIQEQMTFYYSFPTAFRHFLSALPGTWNFSKLRLIRLEGEPVYRSDVELYRKHFSSDCLLVNSFCSTETGPMCLYFLDKAMEVAGTSVPAGFPVDGMEVLVLDEHGKQVGSNQPGEIAVRSRYLSSGYWGRPELTQEKFFSGPQTEEERLYLTGDLGQFSDGGCLELLGRKDFQVKIRSFRVDVGEVEAELAVHPGVKEVAVIGKKDHSENTRLVAYLVPHSHPAPTVSSLRAFLKDRLPDHMIPTAFVTLDKLPLLSTGRVDRRALPDPGHARPELDTAYVTPRTAIERELWRIWTEVLGLGQIGVHDNFFDLGGDSLTATRVVSQVIKTFQLDLPVKSLFDSPTVAEMAIVVAQNQAKKLGEEELARLLSELESITEDEAQRLRAKESFAGREQLVSGTSEQTEERLAGELAK
jgi:amino acid adenylation domain-containing protein